MAQGRLAENVAYFGRALRAAGMSVGPGDVLDAVGALEVAGIGGRHDFYWTLHAVFVRRHEDHDVFDQAFRIFWRRRGATERLIAMLSPPAPARPAEAAPAPSRRVEEALFGGIGRRREVEAPQIEFDARLTASDDDVLRTRDFAQMSAAEMAEARRRIARLVLPDDMTPTRRTRPAPDGARLDMRATLRAGLSMGGQMLLPRFRAPRHRPPPVVALVDISGSMADYSRAVLHFLHALSAQRRVHTFLFGTRLTNVTRAMRQRDPDAALAGVAGAVKDWSGGTRIGTSLRTFNKDWSRRVLGQGPVVLLVTDGLERDADQMLEVEIDRLHRSCRRLVWLNPLLRFSGFEPKARGIRALLPHVDEFRPVHDLASLEALVTALSQPPAGRKAQGRPPMASGG